MIKRLSLALLALACWSTPAQAAFTHVQTVTETTNQFSGDANSVATVAATNVGNTIVVVIISDQNRSYSSQSCGVASFTSLHREGTTTFVQILAGIATSSITSCSITLDGNSSGTLPDSLTIMEFSGGADPVAESGTSTGVENTSTTNTHTAADVTPDTNETLFVGGAVYGGSTGGLTQDADFTQALHYSGGGSHKYVGYRIQSGSTTAQNFTSSTVTARTSRVALGAMQGAAGGGGGTSPRGTLTGVLP